MLSLKQTIDREWLRARFHVLELAGILDRLDTAAAGASAMPEGDVRLAILRRAIESVLEEGNSRHRAERILQMYSEMAVSRR